MVGPGELRIRDGRASEKTSWRWAGAGLLKSSLVDGGVIGEARPDEWPRGSKGGGGGEPAMKQSSVRGPVTNTQRSS